MREFISSVRLNWREAAKLHANLSLLPLWWRIFIPWNNKEVVCHCVWMLRKLNDLSINNKGGMKSWYAAKESWPQMIAVHVKCRFGDVFK